MTRDEIFNEVKGALVEMFRLDAATVTMDARLVEDLDLDSIDAIDMAAKVQDFTGDRLAESDLRRIRTVGDVVEVIDTMLKVKFQKGG